MSTKTIAIDARVYRRLASAKKAGESFSKAIDRLLTEIGSAHTGGDILSRLSATPSLSQADAEKFLEVVAQSRASEAWDPIDLR